ncbi:MAG: ABC transporter permease [Acidobacteria bacterium]|nr:ABC transporter permease [Acidobacteriota bacterium]
MNLFQDVRFGLRMLAKHPGFTAVVVLALSLGIGANTTVFTLVNAVLFKGLPFAEADRVMHLTSNQPSKGRDNIGASYPDFRDWRAQSKAFKDLAAFTGATMNLSDGAGVPERYTGFRLSANSFALIGQKPLLGRDFSPRDDQPGAAAVAILGHGIWKDRYGKNPDVLGRSIRINEVPTVVIGVMPEGMKFPLSADLWTPMIPTAAWEKRDHRDLAVFGRLADRAALSDARAEMDLLAKRLQKDHAKTNQGVGIVVKPYNDEFNGGGIRILFLALLGSVGFVLLIACANVANLLLARSVSRAREISIRSALGATRFRVVRQLLMESILLGLLGGALGLLLAIWGVKMFSLAVAGVGKPYWIDFSMDYRVFAYLAVICLATGVLFGLAPALRASRLDLSESLKEGGRGHSGGGRTKYLTGFLVVSELALSLVLLVGAGLMVRSFLKMYGMNSGIDAAQVLTMRLNLAEAKYPTPEARRAFHERLKPRLAAVPGVEGLAVASHLPHRGSFHWPFEIEGRPPAQGEKPTVSGLVVSPEYFQIIGARLVRGRGLEESDGLPGRIVTIANQRFAAKYWPGEDPLGKRLRLLRDGEQPWLTVVGVCPDIRQNDPQQAELDPLIYVPYRQDPIGSVAILARSRTHAASLTAALRKEVQSVDPDLPVYAVMSLREAFEQQRWGFRVFGTLFAIFALIALALSTVGIYAVMAYAVSRQTPEFGVRLALGASPGHILSLVFRQGLKQLGIGLAVGLAAAFGLTRVLASLLVQVTPTDPVTFVSITLVLSAAGLLATWFPARRAMKVDPVVALRYE